MSPPVVEQAGEPRDARIESLRALAALAVLTGHAFAWSRDYRWADTTDGLLDRVLLGGTFGVYLFFALSGYLLYLPFARRDFGAGGPVDLGRYARNRALRILPLYWVSVAVLLVLVDRPEDWWRFFVFAQELSPETAGTVNPVWWSLVVEVQFYVVLPLLAWLVAKAAGGSAGTAAMFLALVGAASYAYFALEPFAPAEGGSRGSLPATLYFFAAGMLVALARTREILLPRRLLVAAAPATWLAVFASYSLAPLAAVASALTVAAVALTGEGRASRPLALVGIASYSLYVWHLPIVERLHEAMPGLGFGGLLAVALAACLPVAAASYLVVEAPPLRLRRRWFRGTSPSPGPSSAAGSPHRPRPTGAR